MSAIGLISIDNYDDLIDKKDDKQISYLNSLITTLISDWASENHIFYKRINSERFLFVAKIEDIEKMKKGNFEFLTRVRNIAEKNDLALTISMGISYGEESLETIGEVAQNNLDIALVRGGDQVVLKKADEEAKPQFFGGNTDGTPKRTRVRSRAMSTTLKKIFADNKKVFIMGHRYPDMDALGAAFGVAYMAMMSERECYIILNPKEITADIERVLEELKKYPDLERIVISGEEAVTLSNEESVLVMVDYHKPSMSISQKVYDVFDKIAVIDHHRRGDEFPDKPLLTYIESTASSASELVTELIQYRSTRKTQIPKFITTSLLAGIYVDTKNFSVRTTGRTFDIAGYLKNHGADTSLVQYMLSTDLDSYLMISELVSKSKHYKEDIVIAVADDKRVYDSVTVAKAADTLLSINGIHAAFVITRQPSKLIGISARSTGKINVQVLMEALGGGGHFTNAATQIKDKSLDEVKKMLIQELNKLERE